MLYGCGWEGVGGERDGGCGAGGAPQVLTGLVRGRRPRCKAGLTRYLAG